MPKDLSTDPYQCDVSQEKGSLSSLRAFALAVLCLTGLFTLLFSPVIFTGHLICPEVQSVNALYGDKALWTPYVYGGLPFEPDPGSQYYYPLLRLFYAIPGSWNAYIMITYILSGAFCFSYVRLLTNSNFAAAIAAFAYAFGHLTIEVTNMPILHTSIWLTGGVLAFELLARKECAINYLLAVFAVALAGLSGQPQIFAYSLGLWTTYVLVRASIKGQRAGLPSGVRFAVLGLVTITLGTLIAFVQLFQTFDLIGATARATFTFKDFLTYSLNPLQVVGILMPFIFGGAPDGIISQPHFGNFLCGSQNIYLSFIVMFLSLSMILAYPSNRIVVFWAVIGLATFLLSFGDGTPLAWLFYHIPPFGKFRNLQRILILYSLANAILAGLCVAIIERKKLPTKVLPRVITPIAAMFFALVALIPSLGDLLQKQAAQYGIKNLGLLPWTNPSIGLPCLLILASIAACLLFEKNQSRLARTALSFVLLCDLGLTSWYAYDARWRIDAPKDSDLLPPATAIKYVPLSDAHYNRILTVRGGSGTYDELKPNLSQMWHVPTASGYGPLMATRYGELLNMTEGGFLIPPWHYKPEDRCFDLLSIKYAMAAADDTRLEEIVGTNGPNWRKLEVLGTASVHENLHPLPRTWVARQVLCLPPAAIFKAIKTSKLPDGSAFDPLKTALVEEMPDDLAKQFRDHTGDLALGDLSKGGEISPSTKIISYAETRVKVNAQTPATSILVLSDPYFSGWSAKLDGKPARILCTDYIVRGVVLPPGQHVVEFEYLPPSMYKAIAIGTASLIAALSLAIFLAKRKSNI